MTSPGEPGARSLDLDAIEADLDAIEAHLAQLDEQPSDDQAIKGQDDQPAGADPGRA